MHRVLIPFFAACALAGHVAPAAGAAAPQDPTPAPLVAEPATSESARAAESEAPFAPPLATPQELIAELTNHERAICTLAGCPLPPLKLVPILLGVGNEHSESMGVHDYFSHYDPSNGCSSPGQRLTAAGYAFLTWAENVAAGNATAAATMAQWMASPGHRANILASGLREIGVGYEYQPTDQGNIDLIANSDCDCTDTELGETCNGGPWYHYWTQVFGVRSGVYPIVIEGEAHLAATGTVDLYLYAPATATEMRFSNDGVHWSAWEPFDATTTYTLAAGDGLRAIHSQVRNSTTTYAACDTIWRTGAGGDEIFADGFDCEGLAAWSDPGSE